MQKLGIVTGTPRARALSSTIASLAAAAELPLTGDITASFHPGVAFARRVAGQNLWVWYKPDADHVALVKLDDQPPVPLEPAGDW